MLCGDVSLLSAGGRKDVWSALPVCGRWRLRPGEPEAAEMRSLFLIRGWPTRRRSSTRPSSRPGTIPPRSLRTARLPSASTAPRSGERGRTRSRPTGPSRVPDSTMSRRVSTTVFEDRYGGRLSLLGAEFRKRTGSRSARTRSIRAARRSRRYAGRPLVQDPPRGRASVSGGPPPPRPGDTARRRRARRRVPEPGRRAS